MIWRYLLMLSVILKHAPRRPGQMEGKLYGESDLRTSIRDGYFFDLSEEDLLLQVKAAFRGELERLKNAYAVERRTSTPEDDPGFPQPAQTPSEIIYDGQNFDEINRTLIGILSLKWIFNNNYDKFVSGQPLRVRLERDSFDWLRKYYREHLEDPEDLFALVLSMVVNDLGKDPDLEEDYLLQHQKSLHGLNHDMILCEAAKSGMVPCLSQLDKEHYDDVILGLELGSELNAGQLAQAENVPANLEGLLNMRDHEHAFHLKFMEQILDVAGAHGHIDARGGRNLIEPVFQAFKTVYEVSLEIISGKCNLRQGYDKVLTKRGDMLTAKGFRRLSVNDKEERALLRLLTMGRTSSLEQAELFFSAFNALDDENKRLLIKGLNIDGDKQAAILPYYMPAMIAESLDSTQNSSQTDRERALTALMRYLARVLKSSEVLQEIQEMPDNWLTDNFGDDLPTPGENFPGIVIERNMIRARDTISSDEFRLNPNVLDDLKIPVGSVMPRRRTSRSMRGGSPPPLESVPFSEDDSSH